MVENHRTLASVGLSGRKYVNEKAYLMGVEEASAPAREGALGAPEPEAESLPFLPVGRTLDQLGLHIHLMCFRYVMENKDRDRKLPEGN